MISDQKKKMIPDTQKTPTAQNQHTYVQGDWKKDKNNMHLYMLPWYMNTQDLPEPYDQSTPGIPHHPKKRSKRSNAMVPGLVRITNDVF